MNKKKVAALLIFSLLVMKLFSQQTLQVSLADAQGYAIEHNYTIQKANISVKKAEYAKWQSMSSMLPKVDASFSYNNYLGHKMSLMGMPITMNPEGSFSTQVAVAFSGMQVVGVQLSEIATQMAKTSVQQDKLSLKANVANAYFATLVAHETKNIVQKNLDNMQKLFASSSKMVEVGMAEQTDADQLQVQLGMLENSMRTSERNIELSYNTLRMLLGLQGDTKIVLTNTLDDFVVKELAHSLLLQPLELTSNVTVQLLNHSIDMSNKQLALNKWSYAPMITGFYQYTKKTHFDKQAGFDMTPPNLVGVSVSVPVFSSGERYAKVKQAQLDVQSAQLTKQQTIDALMIEEKQVRYDLTSAIERYELQVKNMSLNERILKNATQKYELGLISSTELTTINNNVLNSQSQYIGALMDVLTTTTRLKQLLNKL